MGSIEKPIIMIAKKAVKKDTCKLILHKFRTKELDDTVVTDDNNLVFAPVDETKMDNFKYMSEGKKYWSTTPVEQVWTSHLCHLHRSGWYFPLGL